MSGRRMRRLVLVAIVAGIGWWIYKYRPTASGVIDSLTNPLMGSKAAVKESERNRVVGDASAVAAEQNDASVAALHEGMTSSELRELLGSPDRVDETRAENGSVRATWTYTRHHRVLVLENGRVISIALKP
jgi:hypothetical protein